MLRSGKSALLSALGDSSATSPSPSELPADLLLPDAAQVDTWCLKYVGTFVNDFREGNGTLERRSLGALPADDPLFLRYSGAWHHGRRHGEGRQTDAGGAYE